MAVKNSGAVGYSEFLEFLNTREGHIEDLLRRLAESTELSPTQYQQATERYEKVADWLSVPDSHLDKHDPHIFPQGSMALGTTNKPWHQEEFDLDFVALLRNPQTLFTPLELLELLEFRLKQSPHYKTLLSRKRRCVRLSYANQFHMDILPAIPDHQKGHDCIQVPDVSNGGLGNWKPSNPLGYLNWFDDCANRVLMQMAEGIQFKAQVDPVPDQVPSYAKPPLKVVVQLMKRHRDVLFSEKPNMAPISIVITTLAADHYYGEANPVSAMDNILRRIQKQIDETPGIIRVYNPSNPDELLSERWENNIGLYLAFTQWVATLQSQWEDLMISRGLYFNNQLSDMFGDIRTKRILGDQARFMAEASSRNKLAVASTGLLTPVSHQSSHTPVRKHNFYGA